MRFNETNYNRTHISEMYDWEQEWHLDSQGYYILRDDTYEEIPMETVEIEE